MRTHLTSRMKWCGWLVALALVFSQIAVLSHASAPSHPDNDCQICLAADRLDNAAPAAELSQPVVLSLDTTTQKIASDRPAIILLSKHPRGPPLL